MITLFSQEKVSEIHDYNIAKAAYAEGYAEGCAEVKRSIIQRVLDTLSPE